METPEKAKVSAGHQIHGKFTQRGLKPSIVRPKQPKPIGQEVCDVNRGTIAKNLKLRQQCHLVYKMEDQRSSSTVHRIEDVQYILQLTYLIC